MMIKLRMLGLLCIFVVICAVCPKTASAIDRIMAYHDTMVCVNDDALQPGVTSYPVYAWLQMPILGKAQISLLRDGKTFRLDKAADAAMGIEHWGLVISGSVDSLKLNVECFPLIYGRDSKQREGVVVLRISASGLRNSDQLRIDYGGLRRGSFIIPHERIDLLSNDGFPGTENDVCVENNGFVSLNSTDVEVSVGVSAKVSKGKAKVAKHPTDNICRINWQPKTTGKSVCDVVVAFAQDEKKLSKLTSINPATELAKTKLYFDQVANECVIETPVASIDEAFKWGVLCLEYCYYQSSGWIESLDHWITQYSMMYPRAAEDMGQFERSRLCLLAHAEAIAENGRLRNLDPSGMVRNDFYWNHHFVWNVEHYLDYTGDIETVEKLYPATKRAMQHSFDIYDRDGNLLIGWDQQIGYQEDFVLSPNDAGSASMAGVEMLRVVSKLAKKLGYEEDAKEFKEKEILARVRLEKQLWLPELGRFMYYQDRYGKKHLDGQYHTFSWPAIYNFGDELGKYTSVRHMRDTLISPRGLVYVSENFAGHMAQTTGCQEAAVQTPLAAWAFCAGGMRDEGADMFEAFGDLVMDETNKGCYPETAEMPGTWFSPTASFYIEAVIEGLFGIRWGDDQKLTITPGIPNSWDKASIKAKKYSLDYQQTKNSRKLRVTLEKPTLTKLNWVLPLSKKYSVKVDGKKVRPTFSPAIKGVMMTLEMPAKSDSFVEIKFKPADVRLDYPLELVSGEEFECNVGNAKIVAVKDPLSLLSSIKIPENGKLEASLRSSLMDEYDVYGKLGQKTFANRSFFLELAVGKYNAIMPVDFSVAPNAPAEKVDMAKFGVSRPVEFPLTNSATDWQKSRWWDSAPALGLFAITNQLKGLEKVTEEIENSNNRLLKMEDNVGEFVINPESLIILSDHNSSPSITFKVDKKATAIQFLVLPLVNNIDVYSEVAQITVRAKKIEKGNAVGHVDTDHYRKVLHYPGDLDNWMPIAHSHGYYSYSKGWTQNPSICTDTATFNVITMDFGKEIDVDTVTISTIGRHSAMGIIAITAR